MTTFTFPELQELWIQAGGSKALAPLMAGVALVESSGNPSAYNPSGASGLWQIEIPVNQSYVPGGAGNVFNALDNAKAAVALSGNSMAGITNNWLAFEPSGAAQAIVAQHGGQGASTGALPGNTTSSTSSTSSTTPAAPTDGSSALSGITDMWDELRKLVRAVATVIDYSFAMFEPGQGYRTLFLAGAVVVGFFSYKVLAGSGGESHPIAKTALAVAK